MQFEDIYRLDVIEALERDPQLDFKDIGEKYLQKGVCPKCGHRKLYAKQGDTPTEKERIEEQQVIATYGGLPSFMLPFFPATGVTVTSWDNLSIYFQDSSWRRYLQENPKRSRVEDYNSRNEGYVIEQLGKFASIEADRLELV